jgi:hypothetical protein
MAKRIYNLGGPKGTQRAYSRQPVTTSPDISRRGLLNSAPPC